MDRHRLIVVIGLRRSETSTLLRALAALGADSADNLQSNRHITELNARVLTALGAGPYTVSRLPDQAWDAEPVRAARVDAVSLLRAWPANGAPLLLDDPGAARLLRFWRPVFEELRVEAQYVIGWRPPNVVASAMCGAQRLPAARAHLLWLEHHVEALHDTRGSHRLVVDESRLLADPPSELERLSRYLGAEAFLSSAIERFGQAMPPSASAPEGFDDSGDLVKRCAAVLGSLAARAESGESSAEDAEIAALDASLAAMAPFLNDLESREREATDLSLSLARTRSTLGARSGQLEQSRRDVERLRASRERAEKEQGRLQQALQERDSELGRRASTIATVQAALSATQSALAEREALLAELLRERATFGAAIGRALSRLRARVAPVGSLRGRLVGVLVRVARGLKRLLDKGIAASGNAPPAPASEAGSYEEFRRARLAARAAIHPERRTPGLLSFLTTAWNTPAEYLDVLAAALLPQIREGGHEWVILDNGCTDDATLRSLRRISEAPGVRLLRVERNVGIIRGMRRCLEKATGRYVLPVDSDDYVYPDCARLVAAFLRARGFPRLLYSDEDKLDGRTFFQPYFKPDWDPVLFVNSCYIAHLCAFRREDALALGAYTDPAAEGSHDWDTYLRFHLAGYDPEHLPEVVYSWRLHAQSTSAHIDSKDYILASHRAVLNRFLASRASASHFRVEPSPLFRGTPDHWLRRMRVDPRPLATAVFGEARERVPRTDLPDHYPGHRVMHVAGGPSAHALRTAAQTARDTGSLLHLLWDKLQLVGDEWPWEAQGLMELFPDCVMVGGRVLGNDQRVRAAGSYFGFGSGCDCPDRGRAATDPGFFAQMWKPHSASAVSAQHAVVDPTFLLECLEERGAELFSIAFFGAWLGAGARRRQRRIIYSPFLEAVCDEDLDALVSADEKRAFVHSCRDLMPDTRLLSPRLGLSPESAYRPVADEERLVHLNRLIGVAAPETAS